MHITICIDWYCGMCHGFSGCVVARHSGFNLCHGLVFEGEIYCRCTCALIDDGKGSFSRKRTVITQRETGEKWFFTF